MLAFDKAFSPERSRRLSPNGISGRGNNFGDYRESKRNQRRQRKMRLTQEQTQLITHTVSRWVGERADVYLFGSRLNDSAKGGDVDLLIEADTSLSLIERAQIKMELESRLGMPVDIVSQVRNAVPTPFQTIVRASAIRLGAFRG
ncbi:MAG: nucleotidyltransferase family protein [Burkholderiales bacterium]